MSSIRIKHFRSIEDHEIHFDDLTAFVGPNGSGKSAALRAIDVFYATTRVVTVDDYYNRDDSTAIEISITYHDLSPDEIELFGSYVQGERLTVTKRIHGSSERYHGSRLQHRDFAEVRKIDGKRDRINAYKALCEDSTYGKLPVVKSADQVEQAFDEWERSHPDQCELLPDDGQFFGFRQVGQSRLERFTRFVFVPAVRDAEQDAADTRGSAIYELMELVVRNVVAQNKQITEFKDRIQDEYKDLINPSNVPQLGQLESQLTSVLRDYVPSAAVILDWQAADQLAIPLPKADVRLEEDGFRAPVDRVGHGLQRAFILSLLQSLVRATVTTRSASEGENGAPDETPSMPDLILGIEEPELYQHPNRQRHLSKVLLDLSKGAIPGVARRTQVMYCTHSPLFVDVSRFDFVRRFSKVENSADASLPLITSVCSKSMDDVARTLEDALDKPPRQPFTGRSLAPRLAPIMTPWQNEGFFGDVLVLVEGEDDRAALLGAAALVKKEFEANGVAVIPCIGKENIDRPYLIFTGLGIPTYVVFDADVDKKKGDNANRRLQRLLGIGDPEDYPQTEVAEKFAVFHTNLDVHLRDAVGTDVYEDTAKAFMTEFGYPDFEACKKSPAFIKTLLARARDLGTTVSELEDVVEHVFALVPARSRVRGRGAECE